MANALACLKCGNPTSTERLKLEFNGQCPWCLAAFVLGDPPQDDLATTSVVLGAKASDRLGKYLLTEKLGTGGMGEVWKALDTELNRWVALKFLKDQDPKELARFAREAHMAAKLSHPNIAAVHEIGEVGGRHYIAMQCIEGRTLETFRSNDRRLLVRLCLDAAKALDHAHRHRVIHRDVKPGNLMVEETEEGTKVVVLDFGLARSIEGGEKLSMSGSVVGTPQYLSPEQARGEKLDERTDVYSLGATMYEIFTGRALVEGDNVYEILKKIENEAPIAPRKIRPQINQDLQTIILKCLEKNRERRYAGAKELAQDLRRFLNHEAVLARPPSAIYLLRMRLTKRKAVMAVATSALAVVAGLLLFLVPKLREATRGVEGERGRAEARSHAQLHIDLARIGLQRMEQLDAVDEDWRAEQKREGGRVKEELEKALAISPDHEEALFEMGRAHKLLRNRKAAVESFSKAIEASPRITKAYLERALLNLERYENLKHKSGGGVNPETEASAKLLAGLRLDLRKVHEWSKEIPQLKHAEAMLLFVEGKWAEAEARWKECTDLAPSDAVAWMWRGHSLIHADRRVDAVAALDRALYFRPRNVEALRLRALARFGLHDLVGAIADESKAIESEPTYRAAYMSRGIARQNNGLPDEAIEDFNKAIDLDPKDATAWVERGIAKGGKGSYDDAIVDFNKAIELDPKEARAYCYRGGAKLSKGFHDDAIRDLNKAIELDPNDVKAYLRLGDAKLAKGLHDEAIESYDKAIVLDPKDAMSFLNRGIAKKDKGLLDAAIADYGKAIELDPAFARAFAARGYLKYVKELHEEAIKDLTRAVELNPKDAGSFNNRGTAKGALGLFDAEIADYDKAIQLDPEFATAYFNRGIAKMAKDLLVEAIADFDKAIKLDPGNAVAYRYRGDAKTDTGLLDEAIADYDKAIQLDPKDWDAYTNRGIAKWTKGLVAEAIVDWEESLALAPPEDPHRLVLQELISTRGDRLNVEEAQRLHKQKKYREAIKKYKGFVESHPKSTLANSSAYGIACAYALLGEKKNALDWLEKAVEMGWKNLAHLEKDSDLDSLRTEDRYKKVTETLRAK